MKRITKESVEEARKKEPKRICFETTHSGQPQRTMIKKLMGQYYGTINAPFGEGFERVFPFPLFQSRYGKDSRWRSIKTKEEFEEIDAWVKQQGPRVFLRDCLYASVAMSLNFETTNGKTRTEIGDFEYRAKYGEDTAAVECLTRYCAATIKDFPLYEEADLICAVPPRPEKKFDLASQVTAIVSKKVNKSDITGRLKFGAEKKQAKSATLSEKWAAWEVAQLTFDGEDISDKKIVLIDDKYQSGTTMQYIAMKLQQAGACQVYGLSMVKTMRDTDNQ